MENGSNKIRAWAEQAKKCANAALALADNGLEGAFIVHIKQSGIANYRGKHFYYLSNLHKRGQKEHKKAAPLSGAASFTLPCNRQIQLFRHRRLHPYPLIRLSTYHLRRSRSTMKYH